MRNIKFTPSELEAIRSNPYTENAIPSAIYYSLAFKEYALREAAKGVKSVKIFQNAGYDVEVLGKARIYSALKSFKREAASPQGLHESRHSRESILATAAQKDIAKQKTETVLKEMQDRIIRLEQQIEFLKKTKQLRNPPNQN